MRASAGTAGVLGLNEIKQLYPPTTAYLLTSGICKKSCGFCGNNDRLARITWPKYDKNLLLEKLKDAPFERICLQTVVNKEAQQELKDVLPELIKTKKPVCLCSQQGEEYLKLGLDRWTIPLDVADAKLYASIKGGDWEKELSHLKALAKKYPKQIGTHIIAGLGETEEQLILLLADLYSSGISVGLFAFSPVPSTSLEKLAKPPLDSYRRVQIANFILAKDYQAVDEFSFQNGRLTKAPVEKVEKRAFETWGCKGCNRPFYNESPKGPWYNYPRALSDTEFAKAIEEAKLI
ncbi:MAG TPA: radical SAM protein [Firmicutes bacterium]|nr:radical SAM protein [Bacillota bacterium]